MFRQPTFTLGVYFQRSRRRPQRRPVVLVLGGLVASQCRLPRRERCARPGEQSDLAVPRLGLGAAVDAEDLSLAPGSVGAHKGWRGIVASGGRSACLHLHGRDGRRRSCARVAPRCCRTWPPDPGCRALERLSDPLAAELMQVGRMTRGVSLPAPGAVLTLFVGRRRPARRRSADRAATTGARVARGHMGPPRSAAPFWVGASASGSV